MGKKLFILQYVTLASMLGLMVYLMSQKKEPLALLLLLALSAGSLVYGRLFCGYLCPFHAFDIGVTALRDRTVRWGLPAPVLLARWYVYVPLSLGLLALVIVKASAPYTKIKLAVPVLIIAFVVLVLFRRVVWHRYLCPFGLVMHLPAASRPLTPVIDAGACTACRKCEKACPTNAITIMKEKQDIAYQECILCYACYKACPVDAIRIRNV